MTASERLLLDDMLAERGRVVTGLRRHLDADKALLGEPTWGLISPGAWDSFQQKGITGKFHTIHRSDGEPIAIAGVKDTATGRADDVSAVSSGKRVRR